MYGKGSLNADIVFVGEAPSKIEEKLNEVFYGNPGRLLQSVLSSVGINSQECFYTYVVDFAIEKSPTVKMIETARERFKSDFATIKPKVVVAMGTYAIRALLKRNDNIAEIRGYTFWSKEYNCYIIPTYQPGAVIHNPAFFNDFAKDIQKVSEVVKYPPGGVRQKPLQWYMIKSKKYAIRVLRAMQKMKNVVSLDIETDGFDYFKDDILDIGMSTSDDSAITFHKSVIEDPEVQAEMALAFANPDIIWVLQNGKFDVQFLRADPDPKIFGKKKKVVIPTARCDFDTMYAHYALDERQGTHGLKAWAREEFDAEDYEAEIRAYLPNKDTPYSAIPDRIRHKYLANDVRYTRKGYFRFKEKMKQDGVEWLFYNLLMPASRAFTEIELEGVPIDVEMLKRLMEDAAPKIEEAAKRLARAAEQVGWSPEAYVAATGAKEKPKFFNPKSHPQLSWVAYDLCKVPLFEGKKTCNKDAVEAYQYRHPFWKALAEYKQVNDLFGTYVKGMLQRVDPDGRVRPDFLLHGTVTGRLSCHDPNLQNIPRKSFVKDLFICDEDSVICSVDYKTLEVVVASILSGDEEMQRPFIMGEDFHMNTTRDVFGEHLENFRQWTLEKNVNAYIKYLQQPMMLEMRNANAAYKYLYTWEDPDNFNTYKLKPVEEIEFDKLEDLLIDYLRFLTKFITFGIMYGRKAKSLAHGELNCSVAEAQKYIDNFMKKYPKFAAWMKAQQQKALKEGYVVNLFGRKRRWPFITSDIAYQIENQAVNTPIQGSASDINLLSLVAIHEAFRENGWGHVRFTVHDSIIFQLKKAHLSEALHLIRDKMTHPPVDTQVPFEVDLEIGTRYGNVEQVKLNAHGQWVPAKPEKASKWLIDTLTTYCGYSPT